MLRAPASSAFSTSSLTTDAGRSMTSPAAMPLTTASSRRRMRGRSVEDEASDLGIRARPHLGRERFVAAAAGHRVGEALSRLDAGLIEGIDAEQTAHHERLHLEEMKELAERGLVDRGHRQRSRESVRVCERELGGTLLHVQELAESVSGQASEHLH